MRRRSFLAGSLGLLACGSERSSAHPSGQAPNPPPSTALRNSLRILSYNVLDSSYVDLWNALHPGEAGHTWDIERSEMARSTSFVGEGSRHLDRVLLKSEGWHGESIEIIGDGPVTPDRRLFPSDHFGILCELQRV